MRSRAEQESIDPGALEKEAVLHRLLEEFHRLNHLHLDGALVLEELVLSNRKQYGGYCQPARRRIVLSWPAYRDHGWDEILLTFRHEVAHLVHPNHSPAFWELAARFGCPPERRHALPPKSRPAGWYRYIYECPTCAGQVYRRKRIQRASCGRCDRRWNPMHQLRLVASA
ncbi:MAG: YgjP-like metallopeptidase domain-containing protein [Armatimonadota bacterium]